MTLNRIVWIFTKEYYTDTEKFNQKVAAFQMNPNEWNLTEIVFNLPELQIQYTCWAPADLLENETLIGEVPGVFFEVEPGKKIYKVEVLATLKAENGASFTALAFLMKAHNQQADKALGDHYIFEGIDEEPEIVNGIPTFFIACGS